VWRKQQPDKASLANAIKLKQTRDNFPKNFKGQKHAKFIDKM